MQEKHFFVEGIHMKTSQTFLCVVPAALVLLCANLFVGIGQTAVSREPRTKKNQKVPRLIPSLDGAELFKAYCATCHGLSGRGDGPLASVLDTPVADLTVITRKNGGVFPAAVPNTLIQWKSLPGSAVGNFGVVHFDPHYDASTRVHIRMFYRPPGGIIGRFFAEMLGQDAPQILDQDLKRLKHLFENDAFVDHGTETRRREAELLKTATT